jgi:hypothetical protein
MDLFVVPTIGFKLLYGFALVRIDRRDLVRINVTTNKTAEWIARQITEAFPWDAAPRYVIRDRDRIYGAVVSRRLRAMGIRDKPIAPASPWQNGFAERLIGLIRHECLDHVIIRGEAHLRRILRSYAMYYNALIKSGHIGLWTKMRRSGGQFSGPELSLQIRYLADFITTTSESRFSVHTSGFSTTVYGWPGHFQLPSVATWARPSIKSRSLLFPSSCRETGDLATGHSG